MTEVDLTSPLSRPLRFFTPLRYPGGKGKLAPYVKRLIVENNLVGGVYVEPYAGGAAVALELLLQGLVSQIHINDVSRPVYAFWWAALERTEDFCRMVRSVPCTVETRDRQKHILMNQHEFSDFELGFATFFLNRTNRSGILNGGMIGGRAQTGQWKLNARYNAEELAHRIESIATMRSRISLTRKDALEFLQEGSETWPGRTLVYLDPPYYEKGRDLYYNYYSSANHKMIAEFVIHHMVRQRWIVSYDNVEPIRDLYEGCPSVTYEIGYTARTTRPGSEIMVFGPEVRPVDMVGSVAAVTWNDHAARLLPAREVGA